MPKQTRRKKQHPPRFQWVRQYKVEIGLGLLLSLVAIVFAQLLYPYQTALPGARLAGEHVGGRSYDEVVTKLRDDVSDVPLTLTIPGREAFETTTVKAGIVPAYKDAAQAVTDYSLQARLVPFSFIYKLTKNPVIGYDVEQVQFAELFKDIQAACRIAPRDAALRFEDGAVTLRSATDGQKCSPEELRLVLESVKLRPTGVTVAVPTVAVPADRQDDDLSPQLATAQRVIERGIVLRSGDNAWQVDRQQIATWLTTDDQGGRTVLATKDELIMSYLEGVRGELYIAPGTTTIYYQDGIETSREIGSYGQGVAAEQTAERVRLALLDAELSNDVAIELTRLDPKLVVNRDYSQTTFGLQALLEQWDRDHPGRYGLMVQDLSGRGISASVNADMDFVTASTFKMFLAYAVLHKVELGEQSMSDKTDSGLSVGACIEEMIVNSTNACALSLFNLVGWSYVHTFIREQFPSTSLDNGASADDEKHTTVRDETAFLRQLQAGELLNGANTQYLLGLMKRQVYRGGIPAGVPGMTVANKVGFYAGYKHDVAIIYAPRGTYILAIMSQGGTNEAFIDLSKKVYALLDR